MELASTNQPQLQIKPQAQRSNPQNNILNGSANENAAQHSAPVAGILVSSNSKTQSKNHNLIENCFREIMVFCRAVGPSCQKEQSIHASLRLAMRGVREVLSLFPAVNTIAASRTTQEIYFASSSLISELGVRLACLDDLGI